MVMDPIGTAGWAALDAAVTAARPGALPAPALWDALVAHATDLDDRLRIAHEAERRSLFRHAVELCLPPAMADHAPAWRVLARRLDNDTMTGATAEACLRHAAGLGDPAALFALGQRLQSTRRPDEGAGFTRRAAEAGHPPAMGNWASTLERAGQRAEAAALHERAASLGDPVRMYLWGSALVKAGDATRGEAWLVRAADAGHSLAMRQLDELLRRQGRDVDADDQLHRRAAAHLPYAMVLLGATAGGAEGQRWLERAAEAGDTAGMTLLADQLFARGEPERAEAWLVRAIRADNTWALRTLLERHAGEIERCERIAYFLELAAACHADELYALAQRYDDAGHGAEVDRHFLDRAEAGDIHAQAACAERLWRADQRDRSESWWRRAIEGGADYALHRLADALSDTGRDDEAGSLRRFGLEPGGATGRFDVPASVLHRLAAG